MALAMRLPRLDMGNALRPAAEAMLSESRSRRPQPMTRREQMTEGAAGIGVALLVGFTAVGFDSPRQLDLGVAAALVVSFAVAARVRFSIGPGFTTPLQLVLVPMLFELPPAVVPIAVALGYTLSK